MPKNLIRVKLPTPDVRGGAAYSAEAKLMAAKAGSWRRRGKNAFSIVVCLAVAVFFSGCFSSSVASKKLARYRPSAGDRKPWSWGEDKDNSTEPGKPSLPKPDVPQPVKPKAENVSKSEEKINCSSRPLRRDDNVVIYLRGIPIPEDIRDMVDDRGEVNLPLIGTVKVAGKTTSEAESLIEEMYIGGEYYTKINVIIVAQQGEYFVRGEVKKTGRYPLSGDLTLQQAIATAGGYTDYANWRKVQVNRGEKKLFFNVRRIEKGKEDDPLVKSGDIIIIHRRIW